MITEEYRRQNELLHRQSKVYGSKGHKYHKLVRRLMARFDCKTVLDYGCGKGSLRRALGECVSNYDPAIPAWSAAPQPADLVVCTDVLEHVEPQFVDEVLDHLQRLTLKAAWIVIATRPASKNLPNGQNTHTSVHPADWWEVRIRERFTVLETKIAPEDAFFLVERNDNHKQDRRSHPSDEGQVRSETASAEVGQDRTDRTM